MSDMKTCSDCRTVTTCLELGCGKGVSPSPASDADVRETPWYLVACQMGNAFYNLTQADGVPEVWKDSARELVRKWDKSRADLASTRTASDTRTAAGEAECDAALGRAAPASQHVDENYVKSTLVDLAARGASAAGLTLCAQLLGVGPCEGCGYRKIHCRCIDPHPFASTDAASRGAAQGRITQAATAIEPPRYSFGPDGKGPVVWLNPISPRDFARAGQVDVEAERKLFEAWAKPEQFDLRRPHKSYHNTCTSYAWMGWLAARTQADAGKDADTLRAIRDEITVYYRALDSRQHGGVAQNKAFMSIESALGMCWEAHRAAIKANN